MVLNTHLCTSETISMQNTRIRKMLGLHPVESKFTVAENVLKHVPFSAIPLAFGVPDKKFREIAESLKIKPVHVVKTCRNNKTYLYNRQVVEEIARKYQAERGLVTIKNDVFFNIKQYREAQKGLVCEPPIETAQTVRKMEAAIRKAARSGFPKKAEGRDDLLQAIKSCLRFTATNRWKEFFGEHLPALLKDLHLAFGSRVAEALQILADLKRLEAAYTHPVPRNENWKTIVAEVSGWHTNMGESKRVVMEWLLERDGYQFGRNGTPEGFYEKSLGWSKNEPLAVRLSATFPATLEIYMGGKKMGGIGRLPLNKQQAKILQRAKSYEEESKTTLKEFASTMFYRINDQDTVCGE